MFRLLLYIYTIFLAVLISLVYCVSSVETSDTYDQAMLAFPSGTDTTGSITVRRNLQKKGKGSDIRSEGNDRETQSLGTSSDLELIGKILGKSSKGYERAQDIDRLRDLKKAKKRNNNNYDGIKTTRKQNFTSKIRSDIHKSLNEWLNIPMPNKSYYSGFNPPSDPIRWRTAQLQASRGEQVLLNKIMKAIKSPFDFIRGSYDFKWIHHLADEFKSKDKGFLKRITSNSPRAPITMLGYRTFEHSQHEGRQSGGHVMNPEDIIKFKEFTIPHPIVAIGNMDENWGWLSTYFLNRTVPWALSLAKKKNPFNPDFPYCDEYMRDFFENPNLVALFVNQHHNCSHHKVLSFPLGMKDPKAIWRTIHEANRSRVMKDTLIFTAGSNYAFRPVIRRCISRKIPDMSISEKIPQHDFRMKIIRSMTVLCMPGLGYDTYRLWETLGSGSVPVVERGFGMDRTFYRLPVILVDDFAELNPFMLRQAYIEALYLSESWEYERMTTQYWQRLVYQTSEYADISYMLDRHPITAEDRNFTRPLVPYNCETLNCGPGTKRTPKIYCAIDPMSINPSYTWVWNHSAPL